MDTELVQKIGKNNTTGKGNPCIQESLLTFEVKRMEQ